MRDGRGLVVPVIALAAALTALQAVRALSSFAALDDLQRAGAADVTLSPLSTTYGQTGLALGLLLLPSWFVTCRWLLGSRAAARTARPGVDLGRSSTWVWLGWWFPVVWLWFPRRIVLDLMAALRVPTRRDHPDDAGRWWAGWLVWVLATSGAAAAARIAETPGTLVSVPVLEAVATWGLVAAAVPWCRMVQDIAEAQRPHHERIAA